MFSGIGGFEHGIDKAFQIRTIRLGNSIQHKGDSTNIESQQRRNSKPKCVGFSEVDKYAIQIYNKHYKEHKNYGDCTKIKWEDVEDFDLLVGGFPCQAFSIAGKREGFSDTRGTLFFEIARCLKEKQPRLFLLENVKGLLSHDQGQTGITILSALDDLGYDVQWQVLNSKNFGVPQNRERVFFIGHLRGTSRPEVFPIGGESENIGLRIKGRITDISGHDILKRCYGTEGVVPALNTCGGGNTESKILVKAVLTPDRKTKRQNGRRMKKDGEPSFTLTGQDVHGVSIVRGRPKMPYEHGKRELKYKEYKDTCPTLTENCASGDQKNIVMPQIRRLTPKECERLQGFPDGWTEKGIDNKGNSVIISDTQRYKTLGNAITVNVVEEIICQLVKCL